MPLSRRTLLTSALAAGLLPVREALALTGEPFPVFDSEVKEVAYKFRRREVEFETAEPAGTLVVDPAHRFLYHVHGGGQATRYGASVGKAGKTWSGEAVIKKKAKWPIWVPTPEHLAAHPDLVKYIHGMPPGPGNPMGARALYLYQGEVDTVYRIHGSHDPKLVGKTATAGCFGLLNVDIIHLYEQVEIGTRVVVLG
jgi:lipoprotein-anchoring transpeptidase ErfK/SrfK